jgi:hypothetical protein
MSNISDELPPSSGLKNRPKTKPHDYCWLVPSPFDHDDGCTMVLSNIGLCVAMKYSFRRMKKICHRVTHNYWKIKGSRWGKPWPSTCFVQTEDISIIFRWLSLLPLAYQSILENSRIVIICHQSYTSFASTSLCWRAVYKCHIWFYILIPGAAS